MLHVALETDCRGQHVTVFGHMSNPFARCALDVRQERAVIPVWPGQTAWGTEGTTASSCRCSIWRLGALVASVVVIIAALATIAIVVGHPRGSARMVILT